MDIKVIGFKGNWFRLVLKIIINNNNNSNNNNNNKNNKNKHLSKKKPYKVVYRVKTTSIEYAICKIIFSHLTR